MMGRPFTAADDVDGAPATALVSYALYFYADTFKAYRSAQRSFALMSMYSGGGLVRVEARSGVFDADTETVSPNYFELVSARPSAGRFFAESDDAVAVLSEGFRRRIFGDGLGIGEAIKVNGVPVTVIGVAADGFAGLQFDGTTDIIAPFAVMRAAGGGPAGPMGPFRSATWWDVSRAGRRFSRRRCRPRCLNPIGRRCSVSGWTWHRSRRAFRLSAPDTAPRSWCSWA
jgi:hypothetical protein